MMTGRNPLSDIPKEYRFRDPADRIVRILVWLCAACFVGGFLVGVVVSL